MPRSARAQSGPQRYLQIFHPNGTSQRLGERTPPEELIGRLSAFRDRMTVAYNMQNVTIAHNGWQNAQLSTAQSHQEILASAASAYWGWVYASEQLQISRDSVAVAEEVGQAKHPHLGDEVFHHAGRHLRHVERAELQQLDGRALRPELAARIDVHPHRPVRQLHQPVAEPEQRLVHRGLDVERAGDAQHRRVVGVGAAPEGEGQEGIGEPLICLLSICSNPFRDILFTRIQFESVS